MSSNPIIGSVLVIGGGIAGMQSALDCANSGFKVYLLEEKPALGGNMVQLDKTFPTNDCAMCMISPKLVEVGRHNNIDIISYSDLEEVEGEAGNFAIRINKKSRYIIEDKCNGCGDCETACPVSVENTFNGKLSERKAVYRLYPQAIPNVYTIDKNSLPAPCKSACPSEINVQGYIALISKGKFIEALNLIRERMPFAAVCGRACHHPCEDKCNRSEMDDPVAIRNLKRFVSDFEYKKLSENESVDHESTANNSNEQVGSKIAVIGAGPAGLTCADNLCNKGYSVTIFEAKDKAGGMMQYGMPSYRLPKDYLNHEINLILRKNVSIEYNKTLGKDFTIDDLFNNGYKSVFIATGAGISKAICIEGINSSGVHYGIPFLHSVNNGNQPDIGNNIVVIGGGNVALDAARSALRFSKNNKVSVFCLEDENNMPSYQWEIDEAVEEGIKIYNGWGPEKINEVDSKVTSIEFKKCLTVFDDNGAFNPVFDKSERNTVNADTIILAIGQLIDKAALPENISIKNGTIASDNTSLMTSANGIFAGGDVVSGPASVVEAVAHGHRAAESIDRYITNTDPYLDRSAPKTDIETAPIPEFTTRRDIKRQVAIKLEASNRTDNFNEIEATYTEEEAIAEAKRCLNCGICSECGECSRACEADAIDHSIADRSTVLNVGAIIVANGFNIFNAAIRAEYGFGRYKNVITSLQFDRILSASGPYEGKLIRPSDGKTPKKIAWIQCVGSRDISIKNNYCSAVCCMYAIKQTVVAKEHENQVDNTIFYTDIRAFGKGFERYYNNSKEKYGTRFVRSQISSLKDNPDNGNIIVRYVNETENKLSEEEFDIVVLSVGICANESLIKTSNILGIKRNSFGFIESDAVHKQLTSRSGIFMSGTAGGPVDIPETVMQSSAAAALCGELLYSVRGSEITIKEYPVERDVEGDEPRIGVFVCHCGVNIASVIDVNNVSEYVKNIPGVVYSEHTIYSCSQDTQKRIKDIIEEEKLNRVIVASCTPRTHQPLFQETIREAGLNKYLFEMADIREQCSWVHQLLPERATEKARELVRGSIGKAKLLEPINIKKVNVTKSALVIGGGISGMTASLSLSRQGYSVTLIEKKDKLGGHLYNIKNSIDGVDWQKYLADTIDQIRSDNNISVYLNSELETVNGFIGNFESLITGVDKQIEHGIIIVASGARESETEYTDYQLSDSIITQNQLENQIDIDLGSKTIVMIQCAGSRNVERQYCSRVCCQHAIKNAIAIKERSSTADVYILYMEIRTYGLSELYYRKARDLGVKFIHYPNDKYPEIISDNGTNIINVHDTSIKHDFILKADLVVLSGAIATDRENNQKISDLLKVPLNEDGFFMEAHIKLRPVDFANEGIFVCGLAHSPKNASENITQALAAAGRGAAILAKEHIEISGVISVIDEEKCAACLTCVRECIYNAPFINSNGKAEIEGAKCQGCGNCGSACPGKAIELMTFTDSQQMALSENILNEPVFNSEKSIR
jgi:heterodisulfide reductase subunit A-like polyferredoxin